MRQTAGLPLRRRSGLADLTLGTKGVGCWLDCAEVNISIVGLEVEGRHSRFAAPEKLLRMIRTPVLFAVAIPGVLGRQSRFSMDRICRVGHPRLSTACRSHDYRKPFLD